MRRLLLMITAASLMLAAFAAPVAAGGPPHLGFYIDDVAYRTIGTPAHFDGTGAPDESFDAIYNLDTEGLLNVAEVAPGDEGFNGGRWQVFLVTWNVTPYQITSHGELLQAESDGKLSIGTTPVAYFECPVIRAH